MLDQFPKLQSKLQRISTSEIRRSLYASTLDGVFAAVFSNLTGGVLLSNFLVNLHASSFEIGIIFALPMLANIVQPLGAWLGDRLPSRLRYCSIVYFPARWAWIVLLIGIAFFSQQVLDDHAITMLTMVVVSVSHLLGGLGSSAWLSWMVALVPRQLRGRYFSLRNSAAHLTSLIVVALSGVWVANYQGGEVEGYAIALGVGILAGTISIVCQWQMVDVQPPGLVQLNPDHSEKQSSSADRSNLWDALLEVLTIQRSESTLAVIVADRKFQGFLIYVSVWMFSVNLSAPFFNLYLLQDLGIDVSWVTFYNTLTSVANLLWLMPFGRWSDRVGNRLPLMGMGLVMAGLPLLWLGAGKEPLSLWFGLPLLYFLNGGASAAIDLCSNNLQMEIAHERHQSKYFGITAAMVGVSGALGTMIGGGLAHVDAVGGLTGLFVISSILRLLSLIPLLWLQPTDDRSLLSWFDLNWWRRWVKPPDLG